MKYLLDSHAFFWAATDEARLPAAVRATVADSANTVGVSIVSFWEMAIKASLGKWTLPISLTDLRSFATAEDISIQPITVEITEIVQALPFHHGDPFDRAIVATCIDESWTLISADPAMDDYSDINRLWQPAAI